MSATERRVEAATLAAEPAVRAAERSLVSGSPAVLVDTLRIAVASEARRRHADVLALKARADGDVGARADYARAADELRDWSARVYLAALRGTPLGAAAGPRGPERGAQTEQSLSLRRHLLAPARSKRLEGAR